MRFSLETQLSASTFAMGKKRRSERKNDTRMQVTACLRVAVHRITPRGHRILAAALVPPTSRWQLITRRLATDAFVRHADVAVWLHNPNRVRVALREGLDANDFVS